MTLKIRDDDKKRVHVYIWVWVGYVASIGKAQWALRWAKTQRKDSTLYIKNINLSFLFLLLNKNSGDFLLQFNQEYSSSYENNGTCNFTMSHEPNNSGKHGATQRRWWIDSISFLLSYAYPSSSSFYALSAICALFTAS